MYIFMFHGNKAEPREKIHDELARAGISMWKVVLSTALMDMYAKFDALLRHKMGIRSCFLGIFPLGMQ